MPNTEPPPSQTGAPWDSNFHDLMPNRVREVLLVSSLYDAFILEEDGRLSDRIFTEYSELNLSNAPRITHAATGAGAMAMLDERRFDLVLTMVRIPDYDVSAFARVVKERFPTLPVVLLVLTEGDLSQFPGGVDATAIDQVFWWTGDAAMMLAIIKVVEDRLNVAHDLEAGVRAIIVVEDSVRYYSSFLSLLYVELMKQSESLVAEGLNDLHRLMRMRARPKVLLARSYEEALALHDRYRASVIAIISDVRFPRGGEEDPNAGYDLLREVRAKSPDVAVLLQSAEPGSADRARELGAAYADKGSPGLLRDIRHFVTEALGFGDFVFRLPDRTEVARARHAFELEKILKTVPAASIEFHAANNHFSHWLTARCMFSTAKKLRQWKVSDFHSIEEVRSFLIESLEEARRQQQEGAISDLASTPTGPTVQFVRVGEGSIGGKARGLAFVSSLIARKKLAERIPGLAIRIPHSVVVATEEFGRFFEGARILAGGAEQLSPATVLDRCLAAPLSTDLRQKLRRAVAPLVGPVAVRSSSMLEDSQLQPFAGIYATYMLPNNHPDPDERFNQLCRAVKAVYASTYSDEARSYIERTPYSMEEEKMAVLIQQVVGQPHGQRFYPHVGGVAVSYNYYPIGHQHSEDGLAMVALGLGQTIVQGGMGIQFSPSDPTILPQFGSAQDYLRYTQRRFVALDLSQTDVDWQSREGATRFYDLSEAEQDGTLGLVGSVYASDDDVLRDDLHQPGPRVVTFHNILKWGALPLAPALAELLSLVREGMGCAVEIEFAVDAGDYGKPRSRRGPHRDPTLYVLQVRPQATPIVDGMVDIEGYAPEQVLCRTNRSLGHGIVEGLRDIVYVKRTDLQANETPAVANQVGEVNARLVAEKRPYLLVGPGRWGSSDPRLGIPVKWSQISGAKVIVETAFEDRTVEPSQGAHFFHNVTSFRIGYLTVFGSDGAGTCSFDGDWLSSQHVESETDQVRHVVLDEPLRVLLDGRNSTAAIVKPAR